MTQQAVSENKEILITREFDAPRQLVWDVWTCSKHIEKWWGPRGFSTRVTEMDLRVGGKLRYVMIGPDGTEYPGYGVFIEIVPPERILSTDEFGDNYDQILPNVDLPRGMVTTAAFDEISARTRLTLTITHPTPEDRKKHENMGVVAGWNSSLDKLDDYLAEIR